MKYKKVAFSHFNLQKERQWRLNLMILTTRINMKLLIPVLLSFVASLLFAQSTELTFVFLNKNPDAEKISKEQSDKLMEGHAP